jgi:hypothetical protein
MYWDTPMVSCAPHKLLNGYGDWGMVALTVAPSVPLTGQQVMLNH